MPADPPPGSPGQPGASDAPEPDAPSSEGTTPPAGFGGAAVRGSAWSIGQTIASKGATIATQFVLARLLLPSDYGVAAIAIAVGALVLVANPMSIADLLVQRGAGFARALPGALRVGGVAALGVALLTLASAPIASMRSSQPVPMPDDGVATADTPIALLDSEPPVPTLLETGPRAVEVAVGDERVEIELPLAPEGTTIGAWSDALAAELDAAGDDGAWTATVSDGRVRFESASPATDEPPRFVAPNTGASAVLEALGIGHRSLPLALLLVVLATRPLLEFARAPFLGRLRLELRFREIETSTFIANIGGAFVAIGMAAAGAGPVALLMPLLAPPLLAALVNRRQTGPLPRVAPTEREPARRVGRDLSTLWIAQWVHSLALGVDYLILGLFVSSREVGFYFFAFSLSVQLVVLLGYNLSNALLPIFSNLQDEPERLARAFARATGGILAITTPAFAAAIATTPILVPFVFGERWTPAVPLLSLLLCAQTFASTNPAAASLLKATGRYGTWLRWQILQTTTFLAAAVLASWWGGATTLALAVLVQQAIFAPYGVRLCLRGTPEARRIAWIFLAPILAAAPLAAAWFFTNALPVTALHAFVTAPAIALVGVLVYAGLLRVIDRERFEEFRSIAGRVRAKLSRG